MCQHCLLSIPVPLPYVWKAASLTQKGNTPAVELLHENSFHGNDYSLIQPNIWRRGGGCVQFLFLYFNILTTSIHSLSHSFIESMIGVRYCTRLWLENGETELAHFLCSVKLSAYLNKLKTQKYNLCMKTSVTHRWTHVHGVVSL